MAKRVIDSSALVSGEGILGDWKVDKNSMCFGMDPALNCSGVIKVTFTETSYRHVMLDGSGNPINATTVSKSIKMMSGNSYYDYKSNEYVTYTLNGNKLKLCFDIGCEDLYR